MKNIIKILVLVQFAFASQAQINPVNNKISLDVSTFPQNSAYNYDSCFTVGKDLGMNQVGISQNWTALETAPNTYNFTILNIANYYYPLHNMSLDLTITPIHTNKLEVPSDLVSTAFSSTLMISRYNKLLDSVKAHIPNVTLTSLVIGSEHDVYLGSNTTLWNDYTVFYNAVMAHAKILWPGLKVATELTFDGILSHSVLAQTMNTNSDHIGVSYYPLNTNFTVKSPTVIPNDFATLISIFPSKKLHFYQYGYPSSATCASSNAQQTQFITQTFTSWDTYAANIGMIDFTWLHDLDPVQVAFWGSYYGITNPAFLEFLRTLGFRDYNGNGTDKPALNELRCQAKLRGYNTLSLSCGPLGIESINKTEKDLSVYPNPATDVIHISGENAVYKLFDGTGKLIKTFTLAEGNTVNTENLLPGIYLLSKQDKNGRVSNLRIVKE